MHCPNQSGCSLADSRVFLPSSARFCPECGTDLHPGKTRTRRFFKVLGMLFVLGLVATPFVRETLRGPGVPTAPVPTAPAASTPAVQPPARPAPTPPRPTPTIAPVPPEVIKQAETLADAVAFDRRQSAVDLAEALARKGRTDEIRDPMLLAAVVFRWIATNIAYDVASLEPTSRAPQDPDQVLKDGKAVCEGYSCLAAFLLNHLRVEAKVVHGFARTFSVPIGADLNLEEHGHAWNLVQWGGIWHLADFTWGAGTVESGKFVQAMEWKWFDANPAIAIYSHIPENEIDQLLDPTEKLASIRAAAHLMPRFFEAIEADPRPLLPGRIEVRQGPPKWRVRQGFDLLAIARAANGAGREVRARTFRNAAGETELHFPGLGEGVHELTLFTGPIGETGRKLSARFELVISPGSVGSAPPETSGKFTELGLRWIEPTIGNLESGIWQDFRIEGPPGLSLALRYENETTLSYLTYHSGAYVVRLSLKEGKLKLFQVDGKRLWSLAGFEIAKAAAVPK